jgi:hypothetical protein
MESGIPFAYRLIRRGDGNGNMIPMLQGLFTWTESTKCGAEWRDLETQLSSRMLKTLFRLVRLTTNPTRPPGDRRLWQSLGLLPQRDCHI